ncbi:MAG: hypothetical protein JKP95_00400 [Oceanicaulis sp.]|nr:hypothetical protein [Oceanicaulis sp.]
MAAYTAFIDDAFDRFIDQGAQALILDVRDNPGGTIPGQIRSSPGSPTARSASPPSSAFASVT